MRMRPMSTSWLLEPSPCGRYRHRDAETRARAAAADVDPPVVCVDDLADDRESKSRSLRFGGEKGIEDSVRQIRRDPGAVIGDIDHHQRHRRLWARKRRIVLGHGR